LVLVLVLFLEMECVLVISFGIVLGLELVLVLGVLCFFSPIYFFLLFAAVSGFRFQFFSPFSVSFCFISSSSSSSFELIIFVCVFISIAYTQVHEIAKSYNVTITKVHTHIGGGVLAEDWKEAAATTLSLVRFFPDARIMNLGGGFKVARMSHEPYVEMADISEHLCQLLTDFARETGREIHLELEPGAFLTANCGWLLSEVIDITDTGKQGHTFIRLNTGMNDFLRPTLYGAQHPIYIVQKEASSETKEYVVIGHNCESGDLLTPMKGDPETLGPRTLPTCQIGDYCVIGGAGAYCAAMCARGYNSFVQACEIFID
jgi:diaminopimelate decarboxylase